MMINKRLIVAVPESKKYIAGNVALQWCSLCANIAMMSAVTALLAALFAGSMTQSKIVTTAVIALAAVAVRYGCTVGASRMGYLSSKAVKKTLRGAIYVPRRVVFRAGQNVGGRAGRGRGRRPARNVLRRVSAAVFLRDARAADAVCRAVLRERAGGGRAARLRAAHPRRHRGGTDMGEEAALEILGAVHGARRHVS